MSFADKKATLVVDDETEIRESLRKVLQKEGYEVFSAESGESALEILRKEMMNVALVDLKLPDMDGVELLKAIKKNNPEVEVILITGYGTVEVAVEAMKRGAYDFITKPFKRVTITKAVAKALERQSLAMENKYLHEQLRESFSYDEIVGSSRAMQEVLSLVRKVAPLDTTILISGESGTGKELIARAIHFSSLRSRGRFVPINCGAIPESLMESELFGHVRGAFTGADKNKEGLFKIASGGTLFLDEIGNVPLNLQIKLLRAIEQKEILPVGSTKTIKIDIRIIAATNKDLMQEVEQGRFREDLFYRLNVIGIDIPPLRERKEDIPPLVEHFINLYNRALNKRIKGVDEDTMRILMNYQWKGNIRELENVLERAMILCEDEMICRSHLPPNLIDDHYVRESEETLKAATREFERNHILRILDKTKNDKAEAAKILGLSQSSLYRKLAELGISAPH